MKPEITTATYNAKIFENVRYRMKKYGLDIEMYNNGHQFNIYYGGILVLTCWPTTQRIRIIDARFNHVYFQVGDSWSIETVHLKILEKFFSIRIVLDLTSKSMDEVNVVKMFRSKFEEHMYSQAIECVKTILEGSSRTNADIDSEVDYVFNDVNDIPFDN